MTVLCIHLVAEANIHLQYINRIANTVAPEEDTFIDMNDLIFSANNNNKHLCHQNNFRDSVITFKKQNLKIIALKLKKLNL